jgi:hypothetical protein
MLEHVELEKMTCEYVQEVDCCQDESDFRPDGGIQKLILETDDGGGGKFIRIHTGEAGWSINEPEELLEVLNNFKSRLSLE